VKCTSVRTPASHLRSLPHVRDWAEKYGDRGLVVIGVHTPEFAFEKGDAEGRTRHQVFGEGSYDKSERLIQQLLAEAAGSTSTQQ
jgi:hypothetical protein